MFSSYVSPTPPPLPPSFSSWHFFKGTLVPVFLQKGLGGSALGQRRKALSAQKPAWLETFALRGDTDEISGKILDSEPFLVPAGALYAIRTRGDGFQSFESSLGLMPQYYEIKSQIITNTFIDAVELVTDRTLAFSKPAQFMD